MTRVTVVVEGHTERSFVSNVLCEALWPVGVDLRPIVLGPPGRRGGGPSYTRLKDDVLRYLKQDRTAYCSTMLDFYGLGEGFPGMPLPANLSNIAKVEQIEQAIKADICASIPQLRPDVSFIPYIQLHEYEALLFSDPITFATAINQSDLGKVFQNHRDKFSTPEDINDGPTSAPSKRVLQACRSYRKVRHGTIAARAVGIEAMRRECPHFRDWLERLEALSHL